MFGEIMGNSEVACMKTSLSLQLFSVLMDRCCVSEATHDNLLGKGCHVWLWGWCQLVLAFHFPAGTSRRAADSQSSVQLVHRVVGGRGELDCDG